MKRISKMYALAIAFLMFLVGAVPAHAGIVSVFDNGSFVDTAGTIEDESDEIQAALTSLGHTVNTFTGLTDTDFNNAFATADLVLIPELLADLLASLSAAARTSIFNNVSAGKGLIIAEGDSFSLDLMNTVFGYSLSLGGNSGAYSLNAANAAGTAFAGGPATLLGINTVVTHLSSSLPSSALSIYASGTNTTAVWLASVGSGSLAYLGWDWFNASPPAIPGLLKISI